MVEKDIGFVLKRINFRETSIIATLFTLRYGKISGILKGFYPSRKEFTSSMDIFTLNQFVLYPKKTSVWLVSFADLLRDHPFLRQDYAKNRTASKCSAVLESVLPLWERNEDIFRLFFLTLRFLETTDPQKILYIFFIKFLTLCGLKPELKSCLVCGGALEKNMFFSYSHGGMVCPACRSRCRDAVPLLAETASTINYIQHNEFPHVLRINPTAKCAEQILSLLDRFLVYHVHFRLLDKAVQI